MANSTKEFIGFLISGLIVFLTILCLVFHLQYSNKTDEQEIQNTDIYTPTPAQQPTDNKSSPQYGKMRQMSAEIPAVMLGSSHLSTLTWLDIFLAMIAWGSGIFFTCFAKNLANQFSSTKK